ncbi:hypothetical protein FIBSPDRAFT_213166 [Athelia psychrophila]|uniref:BTB domain-containing protein n=1 Tax=Athelia psychrophila TaxID=1759441 RepID=A0A166SAZ7_9AGAM|nr:hypothetical protein FIBSPDRAFT_213166 [Fibularhizoctonia sp. CBS 109695]
MPHSPVYLDDGAASLPSPPLSAADQPDDDLDHVFREFIREDLEPVPPAACDIVFVTSDCANVHAHSHVLRAASHNAFNHLLASTDTPPPQAGDYFGAKPLFYVPETAAVFNIVIHAIYRVSCAHHNPTFDALLAAVGALPKYGVDLHATGLLAPAPHTSAPPSPLFAQLLSHAPDPDRAFALYALAAQHGLHALAGAARGRGVPQEAVPHAHGPRRRAQGAAVPAAVPACA